MITLELDPTAWDLTVDGAGDIATAPNDGPEPLGLAQDVASAARLFAGELYYDTTQGVPYFARILGKRPAPALLKAYYVVAAKTVPGVVSAATVLRGVVNRQVTGQIQITDKTGNTATASF